MRGATRRLRLPGGRTLGYDDHGPRDGVPVLLFHGTPSSRCGWHVFGDEAWPERLGLRIIAPDRPGLGLSDYQSDRTIADWPADVLALAGSLGLERFAVLGYSGGGPYAAACALRIPERLTAAGIIGGTGPYEGPGTTTGVDPALVALLSLARDRPRVSERAFRMLGSLTRWAPHTLIAQLMAVLPGPDREVLLRPEVQQAVVDGFLEALRAGAQGVRLDTALMLSPWGFSPHDIAMPVSVWHGEEDHFVSPAVVRRLVEAIPDARARFYPHEGHVSLLTYHGAEILGEFVAREGKAAPQANTL